MTRRRAGFTIVELLTAMVIVGVLASIAVPKVAEARRRAVAAKIIGDYEVVRHAIYDYRAANATYPPTGEFGSVPRDLVASLPINFKFVSGTTSYRWYSAPAESRGTPVVALDLKDTDTKLLAAVRGMFGGISYGTSTQLSLVVE